VSFASRVAITNSSSYYYINFQNPSPKSAGEPSTCDPSFSQFGGTYSDYRIGQRVDETESIPACHGVVHGSVTLITDTSPTTPSPQPPRAGSRNLLVGKFTIDDNVRVSPATWRRVEAQQRQNLRRVCQYLHTRQRERPNFCAHVTRSTR